MIGLLKKEVWTVLALVAFFIYAGWALYWL